MLIIHNPTPSDVRVLARAEFKGHTLALVPLDENDQPVVPKVEAIVNGFKIMSGMPFPNPRPSDTKCFPDFSLTFMPDGKPMGSDHPVREQSEWMAFITRLMAD